MEPIIQADCLLELAGKSHWLLLRVKSEERKTSSNSGE